MKNLTGITTTLAFVLLSALSGCVGSGRMAGGWGREPVDLPDDSVAGETYSTPAREGSNPGHKAGRSIADEHEPKQMLESILRDELDVWMGTPHVLGGTTLRGVDCSGLVQRVYADALDVSTPRTTGELLREGRRVTRNSIRAGDLVFFEPGGRDRHVGIYLSDGQFAHASSSRGVMISNLSEPYWKRSYRTSRRLLDTDESIADAVEFGIEAERVRTNLTNR